MTQTPATAARLLLTAFLLLIACLATTGCGAAPETSSRYSPTADTAARHTENIPPQPPILPPPAADQPLLLIVGPAPFLATMDGYVQAKQSRGWQVRLAPLTGSPTVADVLAPIQKTFHDRLSTATDNLPAGHVLLVGDCASGEPESVAPDRLPCGVRHSDFLGAIASDFAFSLPTPDRQPRLAIGRWPVRTVDETRMLCERAIHLDRLPLPTRAALRNRLNFIAGAPGYSPLLDRLIENFAVAILTRQVPQELDLRVLYTSPESDYSTGLLERDRAETIAMLEAGAFLSVICSHGTITAISGRRRERLLENEHMAALTGQFDRTHLFIFTCSSGNFANAPSRSPASGQRINDPRQPDQQSLAEVTLLNPRGPGLVVAASSFSHPLFNKYFCDLLIAEVLQKNPPDWGVAWYRVLRRFAHTRDPEQERMLKDVEKIGDLNLAATDHSYMYNYLGDPTLPFAPLTLAQPFHAERLPAADGASGAVRIWGECPDIPAGDVQIDLIVPRDGIAKKRPKFSDRMTAAEREAVAVTRYRLTVDKTIATATVALQHGQFSQVFRIAGTDWLRASQVRILITGKDGRTAAGLVTLDRPPDPAP